MKTNNNQFSIFEANGVYLTNKGHTLNEDDILALASHIAEKRLADPNMEFTSPSRVANYLKHFIGTREQECFAVLYLDSQHRLIKSIVEFVGTVDGASVYPREIVKRSLQLNAGALIFSHNHPSNSCNPSRADEAITRRLRDALALIDVRVLDHIIVGPGGDSVSMAERGLI